MSAVNGLERFAKTEQCLQLTRERLSDYPLEQVRLLRLLVHIQRAMEQSSHRKLKPYGLNYPAYNVLMMLYGSPDFACSPSDLAEASGEKKTNITRISDELLSQGFIERLPSQEDRRKVILRLTPQGQNVLESLQPTMWAGVDEMYKGFSAHDLQQLRQLLSQQLANTVRSED